MSTTTANRPAPRALPQQRRTLREQLCDLEQTRQAVLVNTTAGPIAGTIVEVGIDFADVETVGPEAKAMNVAVALFYVVTVTPLGKALGLGMAR